MKDGAVRPGLLAVVRRLHDLTSQALFGLAGGALAAATGLYLYEVAARYLFNAPTTWSGEAVQYCLAVTLFLGLPEASRRGAHIAVDILPAALPARAARWLGCATALAAAAACLTAGWIAADQAQAQAARGLMTNAAHPIPRWWITAVLAVGLTSAGLHLLRESLEAART